jgi:hypothetical protein
MMLSDCSNNTALLSFLAVCAMQVIRQHKQMRTGGQAPQQQPAVGEAVVRFQVMDWMLEDGQVICVTGSIPQLGMWQQDQMLLLTGARLGLTAAAGVLTCMLAVEGV